MNPPFFPWSPMAAVVLLVGSVLAVCAQDMDTNPNRLAVSLRLGFNMEATFKNTGGFPSTAAPGPAVGGGLNRIYDDGFVRQDSSVNRGGLTWNWGYEHASQLPGNGTVEMHAGTASEAVSKMDGDPQLGFELQYERRIGRAKWGSWGLLVAFDYTGLAIRDPQTLTPGLALTTDAYPLGGIVPPQAPYAGSYSGPGAVIGDSPIRRTTMLANGALVTGHRKLDASLYAVKLGPYFESPVVPRLSVQLSGGLALGLVDSAFSYAETTMTPGGLVNSAGSVRNGDAFAGAYAEMQLAYSLSRRVSLVAGTQFQYLGHFEERLGSRTAELDLGKSIFFTLGLGVHF